MKANRPYLNFVIIWGAMIFLTIAVAHAGQLGTVNFANGSTTLISIPKSLLVRPRQAAKSPAMSFCYVRGLASWGPWLQFCAER